ncbi:hypothetical protein GCM10023331_26350 [Algivirga pacifica]|uniref:Zinc finger CHC2-type domain-containing protein n=2 Tax=Algivirga pacifica TaxID=1162670 RepID=A0ABP9DE06_9BACT
MYKCFACGHGGDAIHFVQHYHKLSFQEAVAVVADIGGIGRENEVLSSIHQPNRLLSRPNSTRVAVHTPSGTDTKMIQSWTDSYKLPFQQSSRILFDGPRQQEVSQTEKTTLLDQKLPLRTYARHIPNPLMGFLYTYFGESRAGVVIDRYLLSGSTYRFRGFDQSPIIFWYIAHNQQVRRGKVMAYRQCPNVLDTSLDDIKRVKVNGRGLVTSVHKLLYKENYALPAEPFFGEHLLNREWAATLPVAVVESEKSALIASFFFPQYLWLATGSLGGLTLEKAKVLQGRKVILFPDLGKTGGLQPYEKWSEVAFYLRKRLKLEVRVDRILEDNASHLMREKGADLADFLIVENLQYPVWWDDLV